MKERVNRGFISSLMVALLMLALAAFWCYYKQTWLLSFGTAKNMYKQRIVYLVNDDPDLVETKDAVYTVRLYDIFDLGETDPGYNLYGITIDGISQDGNSLVYAYAYLDAKSNDKTIQKMLAAYENDPEAFANGDNYLFVEAKSLAFDVAQKLEELTQNIFEGNEEAIANTETRYILQKTDVTFDLLWSYGILLVFIAVFFTSIFGAFKVRKLNKLNYEKLYELDPALKDNLSELPSKAAYADTAIGAFIHRDHLILTARGFRVFSLNDMRWIYYTEKKTRYYGFITVSTEYLLNIFSQIDGKHVNESVSITNRKKLKENIENLLGYIYDKYTGVIVGFSKDAQAAYAVVKNNQ